MILADTGPLYALAMKRDALHERARNELAQLKTQKNKLLISSSTILETQSLLLRREQSLFVNRYMEVLCKGSDLINPSTDDYLAALALLRRFSDQKISLFDASLAVLSQVLKLEVWTFDKDFDVLGVKVWRS